MLGKTKGTLEQLEPVVAWEPPPCYVSHFSKLREGYAAAKVDHPAVMLRFTQCSVWHNGGPSCLDHGSGMACTWLKLGPHSAHLQFG